MTRARPSMMASAVISPLKGAKIVGMRPVAVLPQQAVTVSPQKAKPRSMWRQLKYRVGGISRTIASRLRGSFSVGPTDIWFPLIAPRNHNLRLGAPHDRSVPALALMDKVEGPAYEAVRLGTEIGYSIWMRSISVPGSSSRGIAEKTSV